MPQEKWKPTVLKTWKDVTERQGIGYQAIDEHTVVERKKLALGYDESGEVGGAQSIISVYDFGNMRVITTVFNQLHGSKPNTTATDIQNFSEVQGFQAVLDAHEALIELGGHPPPVENFSNMLMKTPANVSAPRTATFKREAKP